MIKVYINNEEVVCDKSFTIKEELLSTSSIILNNVMPKSWYENNTYTNQFYLPEDYSKCEIYDDTTLLFEGVVRNTGNISLNPYQLKMISLEVLGYKCLLSEGKTLDFVINDKTIDQAIDMIIEEIGDYGFKKGTIDLVAKNDIIGAYSTLDKTAYDVFQYLSEITQSKWFVRKDGNDLAIDFYDTDKLPTKPNIEYTQQYFKDNSIVDITYSYNTRDYRNRQIITSDSVLANSTTTELTLYSGSDNITTSYPIGKLVGIQVDDGEMTIATTGEEELGIDADFYWEVNSNEIKINTSIPTNAKIEVTYYPIIKGRQIVENEDEINRISTLNNRNGRISRYETRNDIIDSKELNKIGQTYIKFKGQAEVELKLTTLNNNLFNIGDKVYFEAPIESLQTEYLVKSKEIQINKTKDYENVFYIYTLTNTFNGENAINFFDNQRRKNSGNMEEGQFITRYIDINNTCNIIFDNLKIEESTNELNSELNIEI
jgi:hypothetical protein